VGVVRFGPQLLSPQRKSLWDPPSGHFGEKKKPFILPGIKPQIIQSIT